MDKQEGSQLVLLWNDETWTVGAPGAGQPELTLGSQEGAGLVQAQPFVSRQHAYIAMRDQSFVLVDHSTNGTYVQSEDQQVASVHRSEIRLWGKGYISLGDTPNAANVIGYQLSMGGAPR